MPSSLLPWVPVGRGRPDGAPSLTGRAKMPLQEPGVRTLFRPHSQGMRQRCPGLPALEGLWGTEDPRLGDGAEVPPGGSPETHHSSCKGRRVLLIQACAPKWALGKCLLNLPWGKGDGILADSRRGWAAADAEAAALGFPEAPTPARWGILGACLVPAPGCGASLGMGAVRRPSEMRQASKGLLTVPRVTRRQARGVWLGAWGSCLLSGALATPTPQTCHPGLSWPFSTAGETV